jgi:hypothetical protein
VRALELITADGRLRRATAEEHPELFWAVRGGKGNFGVVTAVETDLMPLSRLYGGGLFFPGAATREVLGAWLEWTASQTEEMASSSLALRRFPDLPGVPDPVRGKLMVHVRVAYTGPEAEGERLIRPLRAMGPVMDTVADIPYTKIGDVHSDPAGPAPVRGRGILLGELDDEALERLAERHKLPGRRVRHERRDVRAPGARRAGGSDPTGPDRRPPAVGDQRHAAQLPGERQHQAEPGAGGLP